MIQSLSIKKQFQPTKLKESKNKIYIFLCDKISKKHHNNVGNIILRKSFIYLSYVLSFLKLFHSFICGITFEYFERETSQWNFVPKISLQEFPKI